MVNINESDGTTSACAENTCGNAHRKRDGWNYLRVRGEYALINLAYERIEELPPRARRIQGSGACSSLKGWNYLRVRGEYTEIEINVLPDTELPPRARRIP